MTEWTAPRDTPTPGIGLGLGALALSGFSALVYQVAWQRILAVFSGVDSWSITMIVTAYMVGLGVGSLAGGRLADRLGRKAAARAFAVAEVLVALFGAASPWLYYDVAYVHLGALVRHAAVLPALHFSLLVVPTLLMGASLPLVSRALVSDEGPSAARRIAWLYAANTVGASAGAFATVWWLAGQVGFPGAVRLAAGLNLLAAALGLAASARVPPASPTPIARGSVASQAGDRTVRHWAAAYALSGFIAIGLEMIWIRTLGTMIKASPHAFGHVVGVLLLAGGLGGFVGARLARRRGSADPGRTFLQLQWAATVAAGLPFALMPLLVSEGGGLAFLFRFLGSDSPLSIRQILGAWASHRPDRLALAAWLWVLAPAAMMGPPAMLMGASYAWLQHAVQTDRERVGRRVGLVQAANIFGCALGGGVVGLALFRALGTPGTLRLLVGLGGIFGVLLLRHLRTGGRARAASAIALSALLVAGLPGHDRFWSAIHGAAPGAAIIAEDASAVVSLQPLPGTEAVMRVNGIGHSIVPYWEIWALLAVLPVLAHGEARSALVIGMGTGTTPWAMARMPGVERIDLYEIARPESAVLVRWQARSPRPEIAQFLESPRIRTSFGDGRLALRLEPTRYDVVEADATEPYMAYSGNLYSLEFFGEVRRRLSVRGIFCTYVPSQRVANTMAAAFPSVLEVRAGDIRIMLGSEAPLDVSSALLQQRLASPAVVASFRSTPRGGEILDRLTELLAGMHVQPVPRSAGGKADGDLNRDLFPRDEFDWSLAPAD